MNKYFSGIVFLMLCLISCQDQSDAVQLRNVNDIVASDNGNLGNGADIEINFEKQVDVQNVSDYQIFALKSNSVSSFNMETANEVEAFRFTRVAAGDIYPLKGKRLTSDAVDTDGDLITENVPYRFAILSNPKDEEAWSSVLNISSRDFILSRNNQVFGHSDEMTSGAGSIAIDSEDNLIMADYNIIGHLGNFSNNADYQLFRITRSGNTTPYQNKLPLMGGNFIDKQNVLYQSILSTGEIIIIDNSGNQSNLPLEENEISGPDGIYVNDASEIFIAASLSGQIIKINSDGTNEIYAEVGGRPRGITSDPTGNLYISMNQEDGQIIKIDVQKNISTFAQIPTLRPENYQLEFLMWVGYLQYFESHLYVAGQSTHKIYKIDMNGNVSEFAGSGTRLLPRGDIRTANFNRPTGIVFSAADNKMYVSGCIDFVPQHTQASAPSQVYEIELIE